MLYTCVTLERVACIQVMVYTLMMGSCHYEIDSCKEDKGQPNDPFREDGFAVGAGYLLEEFDFQIPPIHHHNAHH